MDKRILAIFDGEESYAYRLMDFISEKEKIPFEIHVFTKEDRFFSYAEKEEIECLLISENAYQQKIEKLKIPHIIILSENGGNLSKALCHINKYQSCENVLREVMTYYAGQDKTAGKVIRTGSKKMRIIGIYTPVTRCLQTTFSLTLGQMLARQYKTLYLNFEAYSGLGRMLSREFKNNISDLVYYFSCAREKLFYQMEGMIESVNGLDFIPPAEIYQSLSGIRGPQWIDLFGEIEGNPDDVVDDPLESRNYAITVDFKKGPQRVIQGTYDKKALPEFWGDFADTVWNFMRFYGWGEILDPAVYEKVKRRKNDYIYCSVEFDEGYKSYYYIADEDDISVGDHVIVPVGKDNHHSVAEVVKVEYFAEEDVPLPLDRTKHIIRKCTDEDFDPPM